jgi:hypothetical protein
MAQPSGRTRLLPTCGVTRRSQIKRRYTSSSRLACRQNPQPQNVELFPGQDTIPEMQSSRIVPLASAPAFARLRRGRPVGCAVPYSTTRDHCGALKGFRENLQIGAGYLAALLPGLRHSEPVPTLFSRTDSEFGLWGNVIICAVLAVLSAVPIPHSQLGKPNAPLRVRRSSPDRAHR